MSYRFLCWLSGISVPIMDLPLCTDDELSSHLFLFLHRTGKVFHSAHSPLILERISQVASTGVRFCPGGEAVVERLKTKACQPLDEGENPMHSVRYPFVKMSR